MNGGADTICSPGRRSLPLREIATRDVCTLQPEDTLAAAARSMSRRRISSILVVDGEGHPAGIVTERDVVRTMRSGNVLEVPLRDVMSTPVVQISDQVDCQDAYLVCLREGIRHLVLSDTEGGLTGIVSETDFRLHMNLTVLAGRRPLPSVMSRAVLSVPLIADVQQAVTLMERNRDSCVVVVDGSRPVGIVTERDVVRLYGGRSEGDLPALAEAMVKPVVTIPLDTTVGDAAGRMLDSGIRHLVVVDHGGDLAGLFSEHDLTKAMALGRVDAWQESDRLLLRTLIDTIPDLVSLKDPNGRFLACNPRFERFFNAPQSDIIGKTDYDFVDAELADMFRANDRRAIEKGGPNINEEWLRFADDGHRELVETINTPMRSATGNLIGVLGIGRDITAARRAREALEESRRRLRILIEAIPDSVQFKDTQGRWLVYNRIAARTFGLEGVDCRGKSDEELAQRVGPAQQAALRQCRISDQRALQSSAISRTEEVIPQPEGDARHFDILKVPILEDGGRPKGLVIWARDVTVARHTTRALERSLHEFNDLVTRIPVGVFKFRTRADGGQCFDFVSPRWCTMTGVGAKEVYRDAEVAFRRAHPEDLPQLVQAIDAARRQRTPFRWEGRLQDERGVRWLHIAATPVPLPDGDVQWDGIQYEITERKEAEQRLSLVDFALNHIGDAVYLADHEGRLCYANAEACRMLGYTPEQILRLRVWEIDEATTREDWAKEWAGLREAGAKTIEGRHRASGGRIFPVEVRATYFEYLGSAYLMGMVRDITARKQSEAAQRLAASVFTATHEGIVVTDHKAHIVEINEAFTRITGYSREEALGRNPNLLKSGRQERTFYQRMWQQLHEDGHWNGEVWNRRKDAGVFAEYLTISAVRDDVGRVTHYVGVFADITPLKEHAQRLEHIAHYDPLTRLPNRVLLVDRMAQGMAQTRRANTMMAVCYLDLDGFKPVNDAFGHETGDRLLVEMSQRMTSCMRGGDTVGRMGGDEFVLLLLGLSRMDEFRQALQRVLDAIARPVPMENELVSVSASIGVTLFPEDDADADTLLRHADQAMYQAKEAGKNRYHLFDPTHDREVRAHHELQQRLAHGLKRREFALHYQPKVNMTNGEVLGVEALIRWLHPQRGMLLPADFLPSLEGSDLEVVLGEWVLDQVLAQIAAWRGKGTAVRVSVNVSAGHLLQPDFAERLQTILDRHPDVGARFLELEVLESTAIADMERASRVLAACRKLGVSFALDDFGTGYSSLTYFRRLPAETLKIDRSFVEGMLDDPENLSIVESVVQLTQAFKRSVIAEGVETAEHCAVLTRMHCDYGQGFGIAEPMPPERFPDWLSDWKKRRAGQQIAAGVPAKRSRDITLRTAIESHRKWVEDVVGYLHAPEGSAPPVLDSRQCRFGLWYHGTGMIRYGNLAAFAEIEPVHEKIHDLARELVAQAHQGQAAGTPARMPELQRLSDRLVARLQDLIEILERAIPPPPAA